MLGDPTFLTTWRSSSEVLLWPLLTGNSLHKWCCILKALEQQKSWPAKLCHSSSKRFTNSSFSLVMDACVKFRLLKILTTKWFFCVRLCDEQLSPQSHYDFGLRALKSVLVSAGNVKREHIQRVKEGLLERGEPVDEATIAEHLPEQEVCQCNMYDCISTVASPYKILLYSDQHTPIIDCCDWKQICVCTCYF